MSNKYNYPFNPIPWHAGVHDYSGDNRLGIYAVETTQRYVPGTRYLTWDGRVFKYSLAEGTVGGGRLAFFRGDVANDGIAYTTVAVSQVAGDEQVSVSSQSFAEDVLAGGLMLLYGSDYTYYQQRMIVGNNLCSSATLILELEAPLATAVTAASTGIEVCPNPYRHIGINNGYASLSGIPCTRAVSGEYFWQQTWGMCNVEPGMTITPDAYSRQLVSGHGAGAVYIHDAAHATTNQEQHVGFILDAATSCVPFVMLQISI